jgi:hypothetical protein
VEQIHGRCIILKQMLYCEVVFIVAFVFVCVNLLTSQFPQQKEMSVDSTQTSLTGNYTNIRAKLIEGEHNIYF